MVLRTNLLVRVVGFFVAMATVLLLGCGETPSTKAFTPHREFTGQIFVSVTENTGSREVKQLYRIGLDEGISAPSNAPVTLVEKGNSGAIGSCSSSPTVISPDGRYIAKCEGPLPFVSHRGNPDRVIVIQRSTGKVVTREPISDTNRIKGLLWSPDSQTVAVLISWEHSGYGPGDLVSRALGHPVPYSIYTVEALRISTQTGTMGTGPNAAIIAGPMLFIPDFTGSARYGFATFLRWEDSKQNRILGEL
jgi:hypothetical protein